MISHVILGSMARRLLGTVFDKVREWQNPRFSVPKICGTGCLVLAEDKDHRRTSRSSVNIYGCSRPND